MEKTPSIEALTFLSHQIKNMGLILNSQAKDNANLLDELLKANLVKPGTKGTMQGYVVDQPLGYNCPIPAAATDVARDKTKEEKHLETLYLETSLDKLIADLEAARTRYNAEGIYLGLKVEKEYARYQDESDQWQLVGVIAETNEHYLLRQIDAIISHNFRYQQYLTLQKEFDNDWAKSRNK